MLGCRANPTKNASKEIDRFRTYRLGQSDELDHVHPSLSPLDQRDEGLISPNPLRQVDLRQARRFTGLGEHLDEVLVVSAEDRLGHWSPAVMVWQPN